MVCLCIEKQVKQLKQKIMKTTINQLKNSLIEFTDFIAKANATHNNIYIDLADNVWRDSIHPYVKNEEITTWEKDIQTRIVNNPYCRYPLSEKQAYCVARAYQVINPETISV